MGSNTGWTEEESLHGNVACVWGFITPRVVRASVVTGWVIGWLPFPISTSWWVVIWLKNVWYSCLNLCSDPPTAGREGGFHKEGFIGCGRLIKSLTLEVRWRVKAGDKGIDEEEWDFFLWVCVRVDVCLLDPRLWCHKPSGDRGENWTGITASRRRVAVTHRETLPLLTEAEKDVRGTGRPGVMMKEIPHC